MDHGEFCIMGSEMTALFSRDSAIGVSGGVKKGSVGSEGVETLAIAAGRDRVTGIEVDADRSEFSCRILGKFVGALWPSGGGRGKGTGSLAVVCHGEITGAICSRPTSCVCCARFAEEILSLHV